MVKRSSLGRGFGSLIPDSLDTAVIVDDTNRVQNLLISDILPNPNQPRRQFDKLALGELKDSINRHGVLQPIIVIKDGSGYKIIAGERRWRAAKLAKLDKMPAIVRSLKELEQIEMALIENVQRVDLSPLEQAVAIYKLQQQFSLELDQIAKKLGKAPSTVSNLSRLLQLPDSAKKELADGKISEGHARAILAIRTDPKAQQELLDNILKNNWTVRQVEAFVINYRTNNTKQIPSEPIIDKLSKKLGINVVHRTRAKGGEIVIRYKDQTELSAISKKLL